MNVCVPESNYHFKNLPTALTINKEKIKEQSMFENKDRQQPNVALQMLNHFKIDNTTAFST